MVHELSASLAAKEARFAIVVSRFNEFITSKLRAGAIDTLVRHGCDEGNITVVRVPGAFEIAYAAKIAAESGTFDAVVCLGCVIRGQTPHFDYIAAETARGIAEVGRQTGVPTTWGVITADTLEQAVERAGAKSGNKGAEAALSAIELVNLLELLPRPS